MISVIIHMKMSCKHSKSKLWPQVIIFSYCMLSYRIQYSEQIYTLLCRPSWCLVTNYINHPQEICEDVFVMIQLPATMSRAHSFYFSALFQTLFHVLLLCSGEICLKVFLQFRLNKNHVQFLPPAALEATHTCSQSCRQSIHFCSEI